MANILVVKNMDKRMYYLINYLSRIHDVTAAEDELSLFYGLSRNNCDCLVLPVRGTGKGMIIDGTSVPLTDNYLELLKGKTIYTGLINDSLKEKCVCHNIQLKTYLTDDFAIKNNYITTEGVIDALVNNSEKAIYNAKILIIGYGRLGQILAKIFQTMKAAVTISARNEKDIVHAKICDLTAIMNNEVINNINQFDFVVNTIPYRLLDKTILDKLSGSDCLIIDVASDPYGLDHEYAKTINLKTLLLPGIPGKIAPVTTGELIGEFIGGDLNG